MDHEQRHRQPVHAEGDAAGMQDLARPAPQMRSSAQAAPQPQQEAGQADDDLEIPSFLRRLAN